MYATCEIFYGITHHGVLLMMLRMAWGRGSLKCATLWMLCLDQIAELQHVVTIVVIEKNTSR